MIFNKKLLVFKLLCLLLLILLLIPSSRNASLSIYEQKKYKNFLEGQGLYSANDNIEILTLHNFNRELYGNSHAWIIEFYNSWCGFCQRFAPSWKALGTDIKGWSDMIKVGAIDCADDDNNKICREFEIMAYPTLRYFHENYQKGPKNLGVDVPKGEDFYSHKANLIERMIKEENEGRGGHYPLLKPFNDDTIMNLFDSVPERIKYVFLVVETANGFSGAELALNFHKSRDVHVRYSFNNNTNLINNYLQVLPNSNIGLHTTLYAVGRDGNEKIELLLSLSEATIEKMTSSIHSFLESKGIIIADETSNVVDMYTGKWLDAEVPDMNAFIQEKARQALKEKVKKMGDVVFQMDLETALRYSLKHEISNVKKIEGEKLDALQAYLKILKKYFPLGHQGQIFLNHLYEMVAYSAKLYNFIEGPLIGDFLKDAEHEKNNQIFSSPQQWLACKGSSGIYRGYPCGLWKMFHYLTVNAVEQNIHNRKAEPREVLDAMHAYIKNFFGCADCSQHFQEMAIKRDMRNVSSMDSSILWLWMAHNEANKRLSGDTSEDPEFPKYQFPSKTNCPQCKYANDTWNLEEILKYLKHMYSSINVRYIGSDTRVLHIGLEDPDTGNSSYIFKTLDMSLCLILYVSSFLLLITLIRMFLRRRYRKKLYVHDLLGKV